MAEPGSLVTPEAPWLGLRPFTEDARDYFFGRDLELDDLFERVLHCNLTVFFGQSGLGKTSLLRAGLLPRLRATGFLPIMLRLEWGDDDPVPERQVLRELRAALRAAPEVAWKALAGFPADLSLWQLLHERAHGFLPAVGTPGPPRLVFLFDQFEEIFTLGQRQRARAEAWRDSLAALVENRLPADMRVRLHDVPELIDRLDLRAAPAKFVLSLRHDFLHLLERWRRAMPSLFDNRLELRPLNGVQALEAVLFPGRLRSRWRPEAPPLIDEDTGIAIVRFVSGAPADTPLSEIDAVPPLLSLVCSELNAERVKAGVDRIVFDPFRGEPAEVRAYLEKLGGLPLNSQGQREPVSRSSAERELSHRGLRPEQVAASFARLAQKGLVSFAGSAPNETIELSTGLFKFAVRSGKHILQAFYDNCFVGLHPAVRPWLEEVFLSPEGFRQSVNDDTALAGLNSVDIKGDSAGATLDHLLASRVLTAQQHGEVRRLELTHDILAPIVRESRDARRALEAAEAAERKAREVEEAAKAQALFVQSTKGLRRAEEPAGPLRPQGVDEGMAGKVVAVGGKPGLSEYFWDDLLDLVEQGRVVPIVGAELLTVPDDDGRQVPLPDWLARRLAERLEVDPAAPADARGLDDVVGRFLQTRGARKDLVYSGIRHLLKGAAFPVPRTLLELAGIAGFDLFVTLGFDSLLATAVHSVRSGGEVVAYSLHSPDDLRPETVRRDRPVVFHLLGTASVLPDYAVCDADVLEFICSMQRESTRPARLFDRLHDSHLLILGCGFPDWLARFFLRVLQRAALSAPTHSLRMLVDRKMAQDSSFTRFVEHFSPSTRIIPLPAEEFVFEMSNRWRARRRWTEATPPSAGRSEPYIRQGAVFLSYASEDRAAAIAIREALESHGIDVVAEVGELRAGDDWERGIRRMIANCALFVPIISASSANRTEGHFRKEWALAAERALGFAPGVTFIVPVAIDDIAPHRARVPSLFEDIVWARLPEGHATAEFVDTITRVVRDWHRRSMAP